MEQVGIVPAAFLPVQVQLERCPAGVDAALQNIAQCLPQRRDLVGGQGWDRPQGMDPGPPGGRLDVNVADARDPVLIEEEGLDRTAAALKQGPELVQRQVDGVLSGSSASGLPGDFPQPLHVAHRRDAEEAFVLPVKVRGIVVPHAIGRTGRVVVFAQHQTAGLLQS